MSSATIAPEENRLPTLKLTQTLTQTLTLTGVRGQFSSGAIVRIPLGVMHYIFSLIKLFLTIKFLIYSGTSFVFTT